MTSTKQLREFYDAWQDLKRRAEDATHMGNTKELSAAWYDLDMLRDQMEQAGISSPAELEKRIATWQGA